jgi:hypothetical protein
VKAFPMKVNLRKRALPVTPTPTERLGIDDFFRPDSGSGPAPYAGACRKHRAGDERGSRSCRGGGTRSGRWDLSERQGADEPGVAGPVRRGLSGMALPLFPEGFTGRTPYTTLDFTSKNNIGDTCMETGASGRCPEAGWGSDRWGADSAGNRRETETRSFQPEGKRR